MVDKVNLLEKFALFDTQWSPRIIGQMNDSHLKVVKVQGEFVWHKHDDTDEVFFTVKGSLIMHFRDKDVVVDEGELIVVPKGVEHKPEAIDECWIVLFEKAGTLNTGDADEEERTRHKVEWI